MEEKSVKIFIKPSHEVVMPQKLLRTVEIVPTPVSVLRARKQEKDRKDKKEEQDEKKKAPPEDDQPVPPRWTFPMTSIDEVDLTDLPPDVIIELELPENDVSGLAALSTLVDDPLIKSRNVTVEVWETIDLDG